MRSAILWRYRRWLLFGLGLLVASCGLGNPGYVLSTPSRVAAKQCGALLEAEAWLPVYPGSQVRAREETGGCVWLSAASVVSIQLFYDIHMRRLGWLPMTLSSSSTHWQYGTDDTFRPKNLVELIITAESSLTTRIMIRRGEIIFELPV